MEQTYDIVMRDDDFVIYSNGTPLLTPKGNEVAHTNARLLRVAITQKLFSGNESLTHIDLLCRLTDYTKATQQQSAQWMPHQFENDPLLKKNGTISEALSKLMMIEEFPFTDYIFLNSSSIASALNVFFNRNGEGKPINEFIAEWISLQSCEQQLVLEALASLQGGGILIHLLCMNGFLSVAEYSIGMVIMKMKENCQCIADLLATDGINGLASLQKKYGENMQTAIDFLTLCRSENQLSVVEEIIKRGEDNTTEFKSTLRWDLRQGIKNAAIEHASLKTMCAFLNSEGGDLLIGVRDDGSIEGIETDKFDNNDKFFLHIWTLIKTSMGQEVVEWIKTSLQRVGDRTVCRVNCKRAAKPVFLNQKGFAEEFFIRVGPSSSSLEISSALKYIQQHF